MVASSVSCAPVIVEPALQGHLRQLGVALVQPRRHRGEDQAEQQQAAEMEAMPYFQSRAEAEVYEILRQEEMERIVQAIKAATIGIPIKNNTRNQFGGFHWA